MRTPQRASLGIDSIEFKTQTFHKYLKKKGLSTTAFKQFRDIILSHYHASPRPFPWRETVDPYKILVSEIMLQQTQTSRVVPKYHAFLERFPDFESLASGSLRDVLELWSGLGYNRRAKALKDLAEIVVERFEGKLPNDREELQSLPGIGPYTSGAICTFAFNQPVVFMDTNIRRVYIHFFFPDQEKVRDSDILPLVEGTLVKENPRDWYYALMDYGALLKSRPALIHGEKKKKKTNGKKSSRGAGKEGRKVKQAGWENPNRRSAHYTKQSPFEGSDRQIRGRLLKVLLSEEEGIKENELLQLTSSGGAEGVTTTERMQEKTPEEGSQLEKDRVRYILHQLEQEGFVKEEKGKYSIADK